MTNPYNIRLAKDNDAPSIWEIFSEVTKTGDTYVFDPNTPKEDLEKHWLAEYMHTYVVEREGKIVGTYILKPNQPGLGAHIANGSYMVHPKVQGKGIGKLMCDHSIDQAIHLGFHGIQFNIVVSTNRAAIKLWEKYGFKIIGTIPGGFRHSTLGYVDAYIMFRLLKRDEE